MEIQNRMMIQDNFKQALGRFATGVCVITYRHPETQQFDGVTISAFSSLSLNPAKILFCLGNWGQNSETFHQVEHFCVNILSSEQQALAYQFAGRNRDGLQEVINEINGLPTIKQSLANIICQKGAHYNEGDHDIIIGNVEDIILTEKPLQPLLYYKSKIIEDYQHDDS